MWGAPACRGRHGGQADLPAIGMQSGGGCQLDGRSAGAWQWAVGGIGKARHLPVMGGGLGQGVRGSAGVSGFS